MWEWTRIGQTAAVAPYSPRHEVKTELIHTTQTASSGLQWIEAKSRIVYEVEK